MAPLLYFLGSGLFFFKGIRVSLRLLKISFKALLFDHRKYIIFCALLAMIKFSIALLNSAIDPTLPIILIETDVLAGLNFFEILFTYLEMPLSLSRFACLLVQTFIFFIGLILIWFLYVATADYFQHTLHNKKQSVKKSFRNSFKKWKTIIPWTAIELMVLFLAAMLGPVGNVLYLLWQIATALIVPIIAFESKSIFTLFKESKLRFKQKFSKIFGVSLLVELLLGILTALFYFTYSKTAAANIGIFAFLNNNFIIFCMIYISAVVSIAEIIALTNVYHLSQQNTIAKIEKESEGA